MLQHNLLLNTDMCLFLQQCSQFYIMTYHKAGFKGTVCKLPIKKGSKLRQQLHTLLISYVALNTEIIRITILIASIDCMIDVRSPIIHRLPFLVLRFAMASFQRNDISFFHGYISKVSINRGGRISTVCFLVFINRKCALPA